MTMTMTRNPLRSAILAFAAVLCCATPILSEEPAPAPEPAAGQLLVAAATMQDPRFRHSVILLLRHDKTGAFGIIINRPIAERPLADLLASIGGQNGNSGSAGSAQSGKTPAPAEGTIPTTPATTPATPAAPAKTPTAPGGK